MKQKWTTAKAPIPSPWIAQVSVDKKLGLAYISGLISETADGTMVIGSGVAAETRLILENMKVIVESLGLNMDHIIKTNIFLADMNDFDEMNAVYKSFFSEKNPPARQCVGAVLWGCYKVEISAVAVLR